MPPIKSDYVPTDYYQIKAGKIVQKAEENAEGATKRVWELKDGTKGYTWEYQYETWKGKIMSVYVRDTDFGQQCSIRFADGTVTFPTKSKYFLSFAQVLKNVDFGKEVIIRPYDFVDKENDRQVIGISVTQDGKKVENAYNVKQEDGKWKTFHGFPKVDEKKKDKTGYWEIYYADVRMFLVDELEKIAFPREVASELGGKVVDEEEKDDINVTEIPF